MPPKKSKSTTTPKKTKKSDSKSKKRKQKADSSAESDEEYKIEDFSEDDDVEEEKRLRKKLSATRLDDGSDFEGDEPSKDDLGSSKKKNGKKARKNNDKDTSKKSRGKMTPEKKTPAPKKAKSKGSNSAKFGSIIVKGKTLDAKNDELTNNLLDQPLDFDMGGQNATEEDAYIPPWSKEPQMRDKKMRYTTDPNYDPTTLHIPEDEFKKMTPVLQQYWKIKQNHFDKLVAIKIWKFYYFYYQDAIIVHKLIDMKLTLQKNWTLTFFHESCMNRFSPILLEHGHQVMILEQMEEINKSKKDVIRREICQVLTRGTAIDHNLADYSSRFLLAIFEDQLKFGLLFVDTTTHEFYVGEFEDDDTRSNLRTAVMRLKPVEIIYMKGYLKAETANLLKFLPVKPTISVVKENTPTTVKELFSNLGKYFKEKKDMEAEGNESWRMPELINQMKGAFDSAPTPRTQSQNSEGVDELVKDWKKPFFFAFQAIAMGLNYLKSVMLDETVFQMGQFINFDINLQKHSTLFMDAQALQNLEVLEVNYLNSVSEQNTLMSFMDYTKTQFGKRMFRRWLTSPQLDVDSLVERQEAVLDLMNNTDIADYFHEKLGKLPDLERMISKIYNLSNKQRLSAIYFEDFAKNRLKDFLEFLKELKTVESLIAYFADYTDRFKSKRLKQLVSFKEVDMDNFVKKKVKRSNGKDSVNSVTAGVFPRINSIIADLEHMVEYREGVPTPAPGISKENDEIVTRIRKLKESLNSHLEEQRSFFKAKNVNFVHSKHRYEIEIPEDLVEGKKRPADFTITSKRKGFLRFHTPFVESQLHKLYEYECEFQKVLIPFIVDYFRKFYERHSLWNQVISCLGELDCLCSLAKLASSMKGGCCRPVLRKSNEPVFELTEMIHPCLAKSGVKFVPNDVVFEKEKSVFLVTGPNMGGKSTLLRMSCIAVIMAQVGSWVPAKHFELTPVDRIFTRIGAADRILEGKSTFFVEMEETLNLVKDSTRNSMVIIDELGRGTSTYDGVAIAHAVLKYLAQEIKCFLLFATHYHLLLDEFALYSNVSCFHMACEFDEEKDVVKFLYKFIKGNALSYGINVAKMAGLPIETVMIAKEKSELMIQEKKNIFSAKNIANKFNNLIAVLAEADENGFKEAEKVVKSLLKALSS